MSEMPNDTGGEWISITEAAARLSDTGDHVDRSTLSRYLTQYAEALPTRREGKSNLVEFGTLVEHRSENIRLRKSSPPARKVVGQQQSPGRFRGTQSDGLARKVNAEAEIKEMDLAERRGDLTPTSEVDQAGRDAIALMLAAFDRAVETEAATLSVRYGWEERVTRIALKSFAKRGIEIFNREIRERLDRKRREAFADDDDGVGDADRVTALQ